MTTQAHLTRLELRHRALDLQRRRFWRELSYGAIIVAADVLALAMIFTAFAMLPLERFYALLNPDGQSFLTGLIPLSPPALARRLTSLIFCLMATGAYTQTERHAVPWRTFIALLLGLALPRWNEVWGPGVMSRWIAVGVVLLSSWGILLVQRRALARALSPIDPRRLDAARTLVVGPAAEIERLRRDRAQGLESRSMPAVYELTARWGEAGGEGMPELYDRVADANADAIVLVGAVSDVVLQSVMIAASSAGARVYATRREAFRQLDEPSFVLRRAEPLMLLSRPALVGSQLVLKRVMDLVGSVVGLVVLSPVLVLVGIVIKLTSAGPVLFRQVRVGLGGDPFVCLKFRTMVVDAEQRLAAVAQENIHDAQQRIFKLPNDPRLTSVGRFLRRSSLDELPQLWNVVRGEMSLVGPRPALPSEVLRYESHHFVRFEVLPGITGPWQVGGRNAIRDFEDVVRLESAYVRGWTLWRDLEILARTIPAVVSMKGAF
ncbi:MAG: exopolysaccharide biosynthesis polyprenyl glycosylphosphotransferase [Gemmatimonadetes bacterium]|nr:exopolysaccharide biosynthesis polyprenyl glycosylphosphotransferase [Gemmatimonadota bacterium]